jgi:amino acid transporter
MNIVSLCAVGAGLVMPIVANIAGIVFGHLGARASKRGEADYRGVGLAGLILNYIFAILGVLGIIAYVIFIVWAIRDCANNPNGSFCSSSTYGN